MRGDQLSRQWRILRTIESKKHGTTVAELAAQEDCSSRTIWRDLAAVQKAQLPLLFQFLTHCVILNTNGRHNSQRETCNAKRIQWTMEVRGLVEVMSWVLGFGRHAEVLEPEHLRQAVAAELEATARRYVENLEVSAAIE